MTRLFMSTDVTIRRATLADAALLAELGARSFLEAYLGIMPEASMRAFTVQRYGVAQQEVELADPAVHFFIGFVGGEPAGYAMLRAGPPSIPCPGARLVELSRLYLEQRWTGQGVGTALLRACLDEGKQRGHDVLWLNVWEGNPRACAFYERRGFRSIGVQPFILADAVLSDFVMVREL